MEIFLSITFLFYSFIIIHFIIQEKKDKIKEIIKIIHIQPFINYLAWALRPFFILTITNFSITGILVHYFAFTIDKSSSNNASRKVLLT